MDEEVAALDLLAQAERNVVTAEDQVARQELRVRRLRENGRDTTDAERLLDAFRALLRVMIRNREARAQLTKSVTGPK